MDWPCNYLLIWKWIYVQDICIFSFYVLVLMAFQTTMKYTFIYKIVRASWNFIFVYFFSRNLMFIKLVTKEPLMRMEILGDGIGCEWMHHKGVELCYFIHLISIPLNQNFKWNGGANGNYGYVCRLHCYMCG